VTLSNIKPKQNDFETNKERAYVLCFLSFTPLILFSISQADEGVIFVGFSAAAV